MKLLYKFASRSRPKKFFDALDNIHSLSRHDDFEVLATLDIDDASMTAPEVKDRLLAYPKVRAIFGTSAGKLHAVNRDMMFAGEWSIGIVMSDDIKFLVEGFDLNIIENMMRHFPDLDGVLHYPDSHAKHELITLSIAGKKYFDRFSFWYNPAYDSVYADNQFTWESIILNKHAFVPVRIYDHFHPVWGMAEMDDQYRKTENPETYAKDSMTYARQKEKNFGLYNI